MSVSSCHPKANKLLDTSRCLLLYPTRVITSLAWLPTLNSFVDDVSGSHEAADFNDQPDDSRQGCLVPAANVPKPVDAGALAELAEAQRQVPEIIHLESFCSHSLY